MYERTLIQLENGTEVEVYLFPQIPANNKLIESGDWIEYKISST